MPIIVSQVPINICKCTIDKPPLSLMVYQKLIMICLKMSSNRRVFPLIGSISLHKNHPKGDLTKVQGRKEHMLCSFNVQGEEVEEEV
jgi:hypothetical protein